MNRRLWWKLSGTLALGTLVLFWVISFLGTTTEQQMSFIARKHQETLKDWGHTAERLYLAGDEHHRPVAEGALLGGLAGAGTAGVGSLARRSQIADRLRSTAQSEAARARAYASEKAAPYGPETGRDLSEQLWQRANAMTEAAQKQVDRAADLQLVKIYLDPAAADESERLALQMTAEAMAARGLARNAFAAAKKRLKDAHESILGEGEAAASDALSHARQQTREMHARPFGGLNKTSGIAVGGGGLALGHPSFPVQAHLGWSNLLGVLPVPDVRARAGTEDLGVSLGPTAIGVDFGHSPESHLFYRPGLLGTLLGLKGGDRPVRAAKDVPEGVARAVEDLKEKTSQAAHPMYYQQQQPPRPAGPLWGGLGAGATWLLSTGTGERLGEHVGGDLVRRLRDRAAAEADPARVAALLDDAAKAKAIAPKAGLYGGALLGIPLALHVGKYISQSPRKGFMEHMP